MQTVWFNHLKDAEEQRKFKEMVEGSQKVLDRLSEIVYNRSKMGIQPVSDYESPNWAYRQADWIGEQRAYNWLLDLLNSDKEKGKP